MITDTNNTHGMDLVDKSVDRKFLNVFDKTFPNFLLPNRYPKRELTDNTIKPTKWITRMEKYHFLFTSLLLLDNSEGKQGFKIKSEYQSLINERMAVFDEESAKYQYLDSTKSNLTIMADLLDSNIDNSDILYLLEHIWVIYYEKRQKGNLTTIHALYAWAKLLLTFSKRRKYPLSSELIAFVYCISNRPYFSDTNKARIFITQKLLPKISKYHLIIIDKRYQEFFQRYIKDHQEADLQYEYLYHYNDCLEKPSDHSIINQRKNETKLLLDQLFDDIKNENKNSSHFVQPPVYPRQKTSRKSVKLLAKEQSLKIILSLPLRSLRFNRRITNILYSQLRYECIGELMEFDENFSSINGISRKIGKSLHRLVDIIRSEQLDKLLSYIRAGYIKDYQRLGGYYKPDQTPKNGYKSMYSLVKKFDYGIESLIEDGNTISPMSLIELCCLIVVFEIGVQYFEKIDLEKTYTIKNLQKSEKELTYKDLELILRIFDQMHRSKHRDVKIYTTGTIPFSFDWVYVYQKQYEINPEPVYRRTVELIRSILSTSYYRIKVG